MASKPSKRLVVCADDFGMSRPINDAILQLAEQGRLNATSCLVDGAAFQAQASALKQSGLQVGLHLNFTEKLSARQGVFLPLGRLMRVCWARTLDAAVVQQQIKAQLLRFNDVLGEQPAFIDGHQHVHQFPVIRQALFQVLDQHCGEQKPWLRSTRAGRLTGVRVSQRFKAHMIHLLGARKFCRMASERGYTTNAGFLGVYDFRGGIPSYQALLQHWLENARDRDMIMCHPAMLADATDPLGEQRVAEFDVLRSGTTGELFALNSVQLNSR